MLGKDVDWKKHLFYVRLLGYEIPMQWKLEHSSVDKWEKGERLPNGYKKLDGGKPLPTSFSIAKLSIAGVLVHGIHFPICSFLYHMFIES